jgi:hypothetical protein
MLGGHLKAKTLCDKKIKFPAGFVPVAKGLTLKTQEKEEKREK